MNPTINLVRQDNGEVRLVACGKCKSAWPLLAFGNGPGAEDEARKMAGQCCGPTACADCGAPKERNSYCRPCSDKRDAARLQAAFDKARKVPVAEYDEHITDDDDGYWPPGEEGDCALTLADGTRFGSGSVTRYWCWLDDEEESGFLVEARGVDSAALAAAEWDFCRRDGWDRSPELKWNIRAEGQTRVDEVTVERRTVPEFIDGDVRTLPDSTPVAFCECGHTAEYHTREGVKCRWSSCGCDAFEQRPGFPGKPVNARGGR